MTKIEYIDRLLERHEETIRSHSAILAARCPDCDHGDLIERTIANLREVIAVLRWQRAAA